MERDDERDTRRVLRLVQEHFYEAHRTLGAQKEDVGLVEVVHHPTSNLPDLNYVTPRRKTAWIPAPDIKRGLEYLRARGRMPRVQYIEGIFPPQFAGQLIDLGMRLEQETPLMIYRPAGLQGVKPPPFEMPRPPEGVRVERVNDQRGVEMWWYVWRNARYGVLTLGVEPLVVGRDTAALKLGRQVDILLHRYSFPVGVARLSVQRAEGQPATAHLLALSLMHDERTPIMTRLLLCAAVQAALEAQADLIFAPGESEGDRRLLREVGFIDVGSIVCYAVRETPAPQNGEDPPYAIIMAQPILPLRTT